MTPLKSSCFCNYICIWLTHVCIYICLQLSCPALVWWKRQKRALRNLSDFRLVVIFSSVKLHVWVTMKMFLLRYRWINLRDNADSGLSRLALCCMFWSGVSVVRSFSSLMSHACFSFQCFYKLLPQAVVHRTQCFVALGELCRLGFSTIAARRAAI